MEVMTGIRMESIGDYIRAQRHTARISLRQLADLAGVSNPYLSQIERGLRKPSAEILGQIAKGLRISAETLYVRAGILEERDGASDVAAAVHADPTLTERQRRVLLDIYESFQRENASAGLAPSRRATPTAADDGDDVNVDATAPTPARATPASRGTRHAGGPATTKSTKSSAAQRG